MKLDLGGEGIPGAHAMSGIKLWLSNAESGGASHGRLRSGAALAIGLWLRRCEST